MIYLLVAALICAIAFIGWRLVGLQSGSDAQYVPDRRRREAPRGPDDDPDFLRSLD